MLELFALVCFGLAWLVPNHYPPWTSFYNETGAALGLLLLTLANARRLQSGGLPSPAWVLVAVATIPWLQWLFGRLAFSGDALVSSLYLVGLAVAIATGAAWARADAPAAMSRLSATVLIAGLVSTLLALLQALQVANLGIWSLDAYAGMRAYANLGQPNNLATLLGLAAVGLLYLYETGRIGRAASSALAICLVAGAALTQSRTALLFGPAILVGLWLAARRGLALKTPLWVVIGLISLHATLSWTYPALQQLLLLAAPPSLSTRSFSGSSLRLGIWPVFFDALAQSPWWGFGWLQGGEAQLQVAERHAPGHNLWMHTHNLFLDLLVWCGYPLGLSLSGPILYWAGNRALKLRSLEGLLALLAIALFGIHAMLELPHHYAYFLLPVGLWIGQIEMAVATPAAPAGRPARSSLIPALLGVVMTVAVWRDYPAIEEDFRRVRFEFMRIGPEHSGEPAPAAPFLSSLTGFLRFARTEPAAGMSDTQLAEMEAVAKRYPYAPSLYRWGRALALNGRVTEAQHVLLKLRHVHGEREYARYRADLLERVAAGESGLQPLLQLLPV